MDKIKIAEKKLEAANLRILAANQISNAEAHERQAQKPIYPGQSSICMGKANVIRAYAARSLAQAELIEASL